MTTLPTFQPNTTLHASDLTAVENVVATAVQPGSDVSANTVASSVGGTSLSLATREKYHLTPFDFGAIPGSSDSTSALQAAFTTCAANGLSLDLCGQTWTISSAITLPVNGFRVEGRGAKIVTTSATADFFVFPNGSCEWVWNHIYFSATTAKTAGWVFNAPTSSGGYAGLARCHFDKIYAQSQDDINAVGRRLYGFLQGNNIDTIRITGCAIWGCVYWGIKFWGASDGVIITGGNRIEQCGSGVGSGGGILIAGGGGGGIVIDETDLSNDTNIQVDTSMASGPCGQLFLGSTCWSDLSVSSGIYIAANSLILLSCTGTWMYSSGQPANWGSLVTGNSGGQHANLLIDSPNPNLLVQMTGCQIGNATGPGAVVINDGLLICTGCFFISNTQAAITLNAASTDSIGEIHQIIGNQFIENGAAVTAATSTQIQYIFTNNVLTDNTNGFVRVFTNPNAPNSITQVVRQNAGLATKQLGAATIPAGQTSITIGTSLVGQPDRVWITLTSNSTLPLAWATGSGNSFVVSMASTQSSAVTFDWEASIGQDN